MEETPVRCTFAITFEDFREAVLAVQQTNVRRQQAKMNRNAGAITLFVVFAAFVGIAVAVAAARHSDPFEDIRPPHFGLVTLLLPSVAMVTAALVVAHAQRVALAEPRLVRLRRLAFTLAPASLVAALMLFSWLPRASDVDEVTGRPAYDWLGALFPHAAWIFMVAIMFAASARATRRQVEVLWEQQQRALSRQRIVQLDAGGLTVDEVVTFHRYDWVALARFIETERLLLACPSDVTFEVIPKRAFASQQDLEAARALLATQVRDRDAGPAGFVVAPPPPPLAAPAPVPASATAPPPLPRAD